MTTVAVETEEYILANLNEIECVTGKVVEAEVIGYQRQRRRRRGLLKRRRGWGALQTL
jgi:hypothetical protein